jgi:hypothetical protein
VEYLYREAWLHDTEERVHHNHFLTLAKLYKLGEILRLVRVIRLFVGAEWFMQPERICETAV